MKEYQSITATKPNNIFKSIIFTIAHLFNDTYPNMYPVLLPMLMETLGFSIAAAGFISTVSAMTTQLLQPLMGYWADRSGGRRFVVGGLIIGGVFVGLTLGYAPTYPLLLAGLLIGGLGNAAFHPHAAALISDLNGKRKGLGMSLFMIGGNLGRTLAPILATFAVYLGGRHGLILVALPGLIMAGVMSRAMVPAPAPKLKDEAILTPEFTAGLRKASGLLVVVGLRTMATMSSLTLIPILWKLWGYHTTESVAFMSAGLLSVFFLAGTIGNVIGGTLSDIVGPKPVLIVSAVLSSIWLILFTQSKSVLVAFILIALLGASLYASGPVTMVFGHALFPKSKGMASGITMGLGGTLGSLGVALIGLIADHYSPVTGLTVAAGAVLLSIPFVLRLKTKAELTN